VQVFYMNVSLNRTARRLQKSFDVIFIFCERYVALI